MTLKGCRTITERVRQNVLLRVLPRHCRRARAEGEVTDTDARLWHPWLRINSRLRVMLHTRWSAEAWLVVRVEFRRALALRNEIRRAGWFN